MPRKLTFQITNLSFLLATVFLANSLVLMCETFLPYQANIIVSLITLTCCCNILSYVLKMNESFRNLHWKYFCMVAAHLTTLADTSNWESLGGKFFLIGFSVLLLSMWYYRNWVRPREEEKVVVMENAVPLLVEIPFAITGNGVAMMVRRFLPNEDLQWKLVGGGIMFLVSTILFCHLLSVSAKTGIFRRKKTSN